MPVASAVPPDVSAAAPTFEALVASYHAPIFRFLQRLCGGRQDAEDLCQETFLRAYRAFGRLPSDANHRAWLYRIGYNLFLNHRRSVGNRVPSGRGAALELPEDLPSAPDGRDDRELVRAIAEFVRTLPPKQRTALVLRHIEDREYGEVAAVLGSSEEAARANAYQALKKVRARFEKEYRTP